MTLTEFLLARKHDETDQRIIGVWAQDVIDTGMTPAQATEYQRAFERTTWAKAVRCGRAVGDLGWALASTFAPQIVRRAAARYADHPDYRDEWRPCSDAGSWDTCPMILTTEEAAEQVGVAPATIRSWVERGHLRPLVPGAHPMRFLLTDVGECYANRQPKAWHDTLDRLAVECGLRSG